MERFSTDFEMAGGEVMRERNMKERDTVWEFRNLSSMCISMSAIYMQMVACMSDRKAMNAASFSVTLL